MSQFYLHESCSVVWLAVSSTLSTVVKRLSTRLTASTFFLSMILLYIWVVVILACPNNLLVVKMSAPRVIIIVAKVWRLQWKEIFLLISGLFIHFLIW